MNKKTIEIQEDDLHAYVDKQLSTEKVEAVEALMCENPEIALQVQQWQQQNKSITEYFDNQHVSKIPEQLDIKKLNQKHHDSKSKHQSWYYAMAASLLMLTSGSIGWFGHGISQPKQQNSLNFVNSAISAHQVFSVEALHPVEVGAEKQEHLVAWLSKRLNHQIKVPELQEYGYSLLGGRLLSMRKGRPAAQFMFEDNEGHRITWLVSKNASYHNQDFLSKNENDVNSFYWKDANVAYSVTSEMDHKKLRKLSLDVFKQMNKNTAEQIVAI